MTTFNTITGPCWAKSLKASRARRIKRKNTIMDSITETLQKELDDTKKILSNANDEWAEDHTKLQELCLKAGYSEKEVYGDRYYVPGIQCLAELLFNKIK